VAATLNITRGLQPNVQDSERIKTLCGSVLTGEEDDRADLRVWPAAVCNAERTAGLGPVGPGSNGEIRCSGKLAGAAIPPAHRRDKP